MKTWIKRTLLGLTTATVVLGGLAGCESGHHHSRWSDERVTEMRGKVLGKISDKLNLDTTQKQKLSVLADEMMASRKAFRGESADLRTDAEALIAGDKFDRNKANAMFSQKTLVMQGAGPKVIAAFGDFYDSLNPEQQKLVREKMAKRGHGWWGRG